MNNIGGYISSKNNKTTSIKSTKSSKSGNSTKSTKSGKSGNSTKSTKSGKSGKSRSKSNNSSYNKWLGLYIKDSILNFKKKDIKDIYMKIYKVSKIGATKYTNIEGKKKFLEGVKRNNGNKLFNFMNKKKY
jgi:hypothetical protein